jgi:hypothetical protein
MSKNFRSLRSKLVAGLLLAGLAVGLTGCQYGADLGSDSSTPSPGESFTDVDLPSASRTYYQDLPDGRRVLCIWASNYTNGMGSVSCDWEHAVRK